MGWRAERKETVAGLKDAERCRGQEARRNAVHGCRAQRYTAGKTRGVEAIM